MRLKIISIFLFIMLGIGSSFAQHIEWATSVINYSSQQDEFTYSAKQVLGEPNSMSSAGISGTAWSPLEDTRKEYLHVGFDKPMKICQVIVAENYMPGAVSKILIYDKEGKETEVYKHRADTLDIQNRLLSVKFEMTSFEVYAVKIFIDCRVTPGENQIDAIGISDSKDDIIIQSTTRLADTKFYSTAEKLDDNINSEYTEVNPKISPDGKTLFVNRKDYPPHYNDDEIWYSVLEGNTWTTLKDIGKPLNNGHHNAVESVTPDGNTVMLINQYYKQTDATGDGFSISHRTREGWSYPENAVINNFINRDRFTGFFLANDGQTNITQLRRDDTKGVSDLYVMFLEKNGRWSEPLRLGDSVNSIGGECTPFLASDNRTLYFSSDGLGGYGSNDIFMSRRKDDSWTNWTTPLNLGPSVNSPAWDAYYSIPASGDYAYFVKSGDIYRIRLTEEYKPLPVALVNGIVYNQKTNEIIRDAVIQYEYLPDGKEAGTARTNPETAEYKIVLPYGHSYGFHANAKGYISISDNLDLTELKAYTEVKKDLYLVPVEVGQIVRLNNIFFNFGKAILKDESFPELDRVVDFLRTNPNIKIEISGHTDNVGSDNDNVSLSTARAKAVMDYLSEKGIATGSITSVGFGEQKPVASNDTEEGRQLNRRVEFAIVSK